MLLQLYSDVQKTIFSYLDHGDLTSLSCCNSDFQDLMIPFIWKKIDIEYVKLLLPFRGSRLKHCSHLYFYKGYETFTHYQRCKYKLPPKRVVYGPPCLFWENFQLVLNRCNPKVLRLMHHRFLLKVDFTPMANMTNLSELYLHYRKFPDEVVDRICMNCPAHQIKIFSVKETFSTDKAFLNIRRLVAVQKLELEDCRITQATLDLITALETIQDLSISNSEKNLSGDYLIKLSTSMRKLKMLNVSTKRQKRSSTLIKDLSNLAELEQLDVSNNFITDADTKFFRNLPQLKKLKLTKSFVTDATLVDLLVLKHLNALDVSFNRFFCGTTLHKLVEVPIKELNLNLTAITNDSLVGLRDVHTLQKLDISKCWYLTDSCIEHVSELKSLRVLNLCRISITSEAISQLHRIKNLQQLDISQCWKLRGDCTKHLLLLTSLKKLNMTKTPLSYHSYKLIKETLRAEMDEWRGWTHDQHVEDIADDIEEVVDDENRYDSEDCDWWERKHGWAGDDDSSD